MIEGKRHYLEITRDEVFAIRASAQALIEQAEMMLNSNHPPSLNLTRESFQFIFSGSSGLISLSICMFRFSVIFYDFHLMRFDYFSQSQPHSTLIDKINMNMFRFLLLLVTSLLPYIESFSQNNHFLTIIFEGAIEKDLVYLQTTRGSSDSTVIMNKIAKFSLAKMDDEWIACFITYKGKKRRFDYSLFQNAQSDIVFTVDKEFIISTISGDINANEQNEYYKGLMKLFIQYKALQNEQQETVDSIQISAKKKLISSFEQRSKDYNTNWILKHRTSPFSVAVIRLFIDQSNILNALDLDAARCFDTLLPQAKENNYEADVLQKQFSKYSDKYSFVPESATAPSFLVKDTTGNDIRLENFKGKWLLIDFWASWCGPCRQNTPLLKSLYSMYHSRGLEVLSISVDMDRNQWKKAIVKDGMNWLQGSDLLGQEVGVGKSYQISAVPIYFLVSPEGVIFTKSIGGDIGKVEERLRTLLK